MRAGTARRTAALLAVLAAAACGAQAAQAPPATERCDEVETPPVQGGGHLVGAQDPPVPYTTVPPTSGWHAAGAPPALGVLDEALTEPQQVTVLEFGGIVVSHAGLDEGSLDGLRRVAQAHPDDVAVTPYAALDDGQVVFTAWGVVQRCSGADPEALEAFVAAYAGKGPDGAH